MPAFDLALSLSADDHYDWYTWHRALRALTSTSSTIGDDDEDEEDDEEGEGDDGGDRKMSAMNNSNNNNRHDSTSHRLFLHTVACILASAADARRVPRKWGGVFGQEMMVGQEGGMALMTKASATATTGLKAGYPEAHELGDRGQGLGLGVGVDMIDRKIGGLALTTPTSATVTAASIVPSLPPMPITLIGGGLGSGKTSVLKHLMVTLSQRQQCKHIAVIVNSTAEINPG